MTKLEQSLIDLCAKYDLLNADVCVTTAEGCHPFSVSMQWQGMDKRECGFGYGNTISEALAAAIASMTAKRLALIEIADEALPELAA